MGPVNLILHERRANWARQLRPRVAAWPLRLVETRTAADLARAWRGSVWPLVVADLDRWPARALEDLVRARPAAESALILVLDPAAHPEVPPLAREAGATHVLSGVATPPAVVGLLARWLDLARRRIESEGWAGEVEPEPEPWERPFAGMAGVPGRARADGR